jgi:hypothetical protein
MKESDGPIVAAVREARARIVAECGHDLHRLADRLRKIEAAHPQQIRTPANQQAKPAKTKGKD